MSNINPSALGEQFDADFQAKLNACNTPEDIKALMHDRALADGKVVPDRFDPQLLHPVTSPQPKGYASTITVGGHKVVIEGATPEELVANEIEFYKKTFADAPVAAEQTRGNQGRFTTDQGRRDEAEAAHRDGGGTTDIEKRLVERYLHEIGISPDALREVSNTRDQQGWQAATNDFLGSHGSWPGGEANVRVIGELITANPELLNAEDKAAALDAAYKYALENDLLTENPETTLAQRIANAKSPSELRDILHPGAEPGSSIWGGR